MRELTKEEAEAWGRFYDNCNPSSIPMTNDIYSVCRDAFCAALDYVESQRCKWTENQDGLENMTTQCGRRYSYEDFLRSVFCPHCGKRIEVVEVTT